MKQIKLILIPVLLSILAGHPVFSQTVVSIKGDQFYINGKPTYEGRYWKGHKTRNVKGYRKMPVVNNEDDNFNFDKEVNNFTTSVKNYVSWGYLDFRFPGETDYAEGFQSVPVDWGNNSERKKGFFNLVKEITGTEQ